MIDEGFDFDGTRGGELFFIYKQGAVVGYWIRAGIIFSEITD